MFHVSIFLIHSHNSVPRKLLQRRRGAKGKTELNLLFTKFSPKIVIISLNYIVMAVKYTLIYLEMPRAVKALITNKINLYNNLAGVFYIFSAIGYWTYMPKYLETIFMQTAVNASVISGKSTSVPKFAVIKMLIICSGLIKSFLLLSRPSSSGVVSITFQAVGLLLSGALISKYQPSARLLAGWNVFLGFLYVIVKISFTQMGCDPGKLAFGEYSDMSGEFNLTMGCNADCNCKSSKVFPVCHMETKEVYYSGCHAGCASESNGTLFDCACIGDSLMPPTVNIGTCNEGCFSVFVTFLGVNALIKLLDSSGRIGNMLVSYRSVNEKRVIDALTLGSPLFHLVNNSHFPVRKILSTFISFLFIFS